MSEMWSYMCVCRSACTVPYTDWGFYCTLTEVFTVHRLRFLLYTDWGFYCTQTEVFTVHWLRFLLYTDWGFYCTLTEVFTVHWLRFLLYNDWGFYCTLTEVFTVHWLRFSPCFFLSCKANARVKLAKTEHGPHSSTLVVICVVRLLFVLFGCYLCCSVYCLCVNVYCTTATGSQPNCS